MRFVSLLSECARNVRSGSTRALLGLIALTGVLLAVLAVDGLEAHSVMLSQRAVLESGAAVVTVASPGGIDAQRCVALGEVDGVRGAFALRAAPSRLTLATLPDSSTALYDVAGDTTGTLGGVVTEPVGLLVSSQLAQQLGVAPGDGLALLGAEASVTVAGVFNYPDDGRNSQLAAAALQPAAAVGEFDACWFTVWPPSQTIESLASSVVASGVESSTVTTGQLNQSFGRPTGTDDLLSQRPTRWIPAAGAVLAFVTAFALVRARRVELAIARHLGQSRRNQMGQMLIETLSWALPSAAAAGAILLHLLTPSLTRIETAWVTTNFAAALCGILLATFAGAIAATLTITPRRMHVWSRDR